LSIAGTRDSDGRSSLVLRLAVQYVGYSRGCAGGKQPTTEQADERSGQ
jgi:hypothetical protein